MPYKQELYPSSPVPRDSIRAYGWLALKILPSIVNPQGRLAPAEAASAHLRAMRDALGENPTQRVTIETRLGAVAIRDFATTIESVPDTGEPAVVLHGLRPELLHPEDVPDNVHFTGQ